MLSEQFGLQTAAIGVPESALITHQWMGDLEMTMPTLQKAQPRLDNILAKDLKLIAASSARVDSVTNLPVVHRHYSEACVFGFNSHAPAVWGETSQSEIAGFEKSEPRKSWASNRNSAYPDSPLKKLALHLQIQRVKYTLQHAKIARHKKVPVLVDDLQQPDQRLGSGYQFIAAY
nr:hypothetical protein [Pseudomonas sp. A46]